MNEGMSVLEVMVVLTLSLTVFSIVISSVFEASTCSKRISENQLVLESIFHTVDTIKSDLNKCGMRLQEAGPWLSQPFFTCTDNGFSILFGTASAELYDDFFRGERHIYLQADEFFKRKKDILIYDPDTRLFEFNSVEQRDGNTLLMSAPLQSDYGSGSFMVVLKRVEYRFYPRQNQLKRKVDRGTFQPLLENVSEFYISYFHDSNSVLYRLEINKKEQVRGYIFLKNMVFK